MRFYLMTFMVCFTLSVLAEPSPELTYHLKASVTKVHVVTKNGGHGVGTGVVVAKDMVATNCHILANAKGVNITKFGDSFAPVALKADWKHDLCIMRFEYLDLKPVELGDSEALQYEQSMFSIGFPGGPPKPLITSGKVKALYPLDDSMIVRTDASFIMGASGSPVFDEQGRLIAISTFKSPGRGAYFYNIPVKWVKVLLDAPETTQLQSDILPFWDAPLHARPYFMQVVLPYQQGDWLTLETIAQDWVKHEPNTSEAHYYLAVAQANLGRDQEAEISFQKVLSIQPQHTGSLMGLGLIASRSGNAMEVARTHAALTAISADLGEEFDQVLAQKPQ
ncbi:MAG: trypsin-like peptidase domain-containing protein [Methylophilus sp.]|nr:trypsin-like peptidase domain-containing protein [Methylophilus sp.]